MSGQPPDDHNRIFISYRRDDARGASGRLYDWLRIAFGRESVFRDVGSIGIGPWRQKIDDALARSAVCIAVIGPRWANERNLPRLHDEADMVRYELVTALTRANLSMVPTLVEGAEIPSAADLPHPVRTLIEDWNVQRVTEEGWEDDIRRLIKEMLTATGLMAHPDVDTLLRDAAATQQRLADLEYTRAVQKDQIDALRRSVDELTRKLAEAHGGERRGLAEAFAALARGDSRAAEDAFEDDFNQQSRALDEARAEMAEAARNVANLAFVRDVGKAATFYEKALALEPDHAETARLLGQARILLGDLRGASAAFAQSLSAAINANDLSGEMRARVDHAEVLAKQGDGRAALDELRNGLVSAERLAARDPTNTVRRRDVSVTENRIGGVLQDLGDLPGALVAYRRGLTIREELAVLNPTDTDAQRDVAGNHELIGIVLAAQGDAPAALASFQRSADVLKALAVREPTNTELQEDVSAQETLIGDVLVRLGDQEGARAAFQRALEIAEALATSDPTNTRWHRRCVVGYDRMGDVLARAGDAAGALAARQRVLTMAEALAARDVTNAMWQRDVLGALLKLSESTGDKAVAKRGLEVGLALKKRGFVRPSDEWMIKELRRRSRR